MSEIRGILWDFGGVLTTSPFEAFNRYEAEHGYPKDFIRTINATNPQSNAWARFERSEFSAADFDAAFLAESTAAGHPIPGADVIALLSGDLRPNVVNALRLCKTRFANGCITNNVRAGEGPGMATDHGRAERVREAMSLFDFVIESSKVGIRKPEPEIYRMALAEMGIEPEQAIFLDDLGVNLKPARAMGMRTIKVIDEAQALAELAQLTGLRFD